MKIRNCVFVSAVVLVVFMGMQSYAQDLTIKLDPSANYIATIGETCSLNVVIENVTNLGAFQFDLVFHIDSLEANTALMGTFLGSTGRTVLPVGPTIDNASQPGRITYGGATLGTQAGANGSGTLAQVVFTSKALGSAKLAFENVQVSDIGGQAMTVTVIQPGEVITDVKETRAQSEYPESFEVFQNFPNPFNPETEIGFALPKASHVTVQIYNALGQEIRTLVAKEYPAGFHYLRWDGNDVDGFAVASGVYFYKFTAGEFTRIKKMSLLR